MIPKNVSTITFPDGSKKEMIGAMWDQIWWNGGKQVGWHFNVLREVYFEADGEMIALVQKWDPTDFSWVHLGKMREQGPHITREFVERLLKLRSFE